MWTEDAEEHISRHSVTPREVERSVNSRPIYTAPGRDNTVLVHGTTQAGRHLLVVLAEAMDVGTSSPHVT